MLLFLSFFFFYFNFILFLNFKFTCWGLTAKVMVFGGGAFCTWSGHAGRALECDGVLKKEASGRSLTPSAPGDTGSVALSTRKQALPGPSSAGAVTLGVFSLWNTKIKLRIYFKHIHTMEEIKLNVCLTSSTFWILDVVRLGIIIK